MNDVFVAGCGLVSPFGRGLAVAVQGLARGESMAKIHDLGAFSVMAALVPDIAELRSARRDRRPAEAFLHAAVVDAIADSGIDAAGVPLFVGTCSGEMQRFEAGQGPNNWYEQPGLGVARALGLGTASTFTSACTSSLSALSAAMAAVARGRIDTAIVAGTDAACSFAASGFFALRAASSSPAKPFSKSRSGLNFGEGAAAIVISKHDTGARARLLAASLSCDAKHLTAPRADAAGLERAVQKARARAGDPVLDVYVSHGTATIANDAMELVLGTRLGLRELPWLAHKAFIGHAMGASALMSFVLAHAQMRAGSPVRVPYDDCEEGVRLSGSLAGGKRALLVAAAFGGANAALVWENI